MKDIANWKNSNKKGKTAMTNDLFDVLYENTHERHKWNAIINALILLLGAIFPSARKILFIILGAGNVIYNIIAYILYKYLHSLMIWDSFIELIKDVAPFITICEEHAFHCPNCDAHISHADFPNLDESLMTFCPYCGKPYFSVERMEEVEKHKNDN